MIFFRRKTREPKTVAPWPETEFLPFAERWAKDSSNERYFEESYYWELVRSILDSNEIRWAAVKAAVTPQKAQPPISAHIYLTSKKIIFDFDGDLTLAVPLEELRHIGWEDDVNALLIGWSRGDEKRAFLIRFPEGSMSVDFNNILVRIWNEELVPKLNMMRPSDL